MKPIVFILILLALAACGSAVQATATPAAFLPYIVRDETPTVRVFDGYGIERDISWLAETFGAVTWDGSGLAEIRACQGDCPATHVVTVRYSTGEPAVNYPVVWSWPDGSVTGYTDERGVVGFGMGPGAYYTPPAGGPHWVTVGGGHLYGIGMIALSNHEHVDAVFIMSP